MIPAALATGPSPQKAKFFGECAAGYEFLSAFYALSKEDQEALVQQLQQAQAKAHKEKKNGR